MSPFLVGKLTAIERRRHWLVGGFPDGGVLEPRRFPQWQTNYLSLLVQRDLAELGAVRPPALKPSACCECSRFHTDRSGMHPASAKALARATTR